MDGNPIQWTSSNALSKPDINPGKNKRLVPRSCYSRTISSTIRELINQHPALAKISTLSVQPAAMGKEYECIAWKASNSSLRGCFWWLIVKQLLVYSFRIEQLWFEVNTNIYSSSECSEILGASTFTNYLSGMMSQFPCSLKSNKNTLPQRYWNYGEKTNRNPMKISKKRMETQGRRNAFFWKTMISRL